MLPRYRVLGEVHGGDKRTREGSNLAEVRFGLSVVIRSLE